DVSGIVLSDQMNELAIEAHYDRPFAAAERARIPRDRVEDGLDVGRRAWGDPYYLARRGLLFQGLGHLRVRCRKRLVLLLQLGEQPDVLDSNDRLIGKGTNQCDMRVGEGCHDVPGDENGAARDAFMHHRDGYNATVADRRSSRKSVLRILADVCHMDDVARQDRASAQGSPARRARRSLFHRSESLWIDVVLRGQVQELSVEANDQAIDRVA